jgi:hypothetical protein
VLGLVRAKEQRIFINATVLERRELDVHNCLVLGFLLGQGTTHKHFPANVLASANPLQLFVGVSVFERGLCFLLGFLLGLDYISSLGKFTPNVLMGGHLFGHPAMADDVSHRKTLVRLKLQHICDQILKRIGEEPLRFAPRVSLPKQISAVCSQKLVVRIASLSHGEGRVSGIQNEENDSESE